MVYAGDRITLKASFRDINNNPYDPDTIKVSILDPKNGPEGIYTKDDLTRESLGNYSLEYDISLAGIPGTWYAIWEAITGGGRKREKMPFKVNAF